MGIAAKVDYGGLEVSWPRLSSKEEQISTKQNYLEEKGKLTKALIWIYRGGEGGSKALSIGDMAGLGRLSGLGHLCMCLCFRKDYWASRYGKREW